MVASFIVPGTVTLRDVSRPAKDETPAQRLYRLACKAVIEGCRVIRTYGTGHFLVTSGNDPGTAYTVDRGIRTCDCPGFATHQVCKHIAMVLAELGELPDPNPDPPAPVAPAIAAPELEDALTELARLESLHAQHKLKSTADLWMLHNARERVDALLPLVA